jgi:hypothetical protein
VQRVVQNLVVLPSVNIYNASDAAGIVFLLVPHNISSSAGADSACDSACDSASDSVSADLVPFEILEEHLNGNFFHFPSVCPFSAL